MVKAVLIVAVLLQIGISLNSEGLARSLAELTAFLIAIALVFIHKQQSDRVSDGTRSQSV
ncbi:hypothetical protein L3V31_12515 [Vibrio sp. J1-1]|uniref:hypothetical protein n=1 Tax=Vibrio sp. J1-1 TaxID=2912251 RepID=UPI001F2AD2C1|nr:hypothetical protein [Vibrio sp. J1-1]MCF7482550.1 hypothetical protein [Vibrio sp. J1-1]